MMLQGRLLKPKSLMTTLIITLTVAIFTLAGGVDRISVMAADDAGIQLTRVIEKERMAPGESTEARFSLTNTGAQSASYTLIEEVSPRLRVGETDGAFNAVAGFVVWRGEIGAGETIHHVYEATLDDNDSNIIPLYAYVSTTAGASAESSRTITPVAIPVALSLDDTAIREGQSTTLRLMVANPFDRPVNLDLKVAIADGLDLSEPLTMEGPLAPGTAWSIEPIIEAPKAGRYPVVVTPVVGGVNAGSTRQATLTVYDGERPVSADLSDLGSGFGGAGGAAVTIPGTTERTHTLTLPDHVVEAGDQVILTVALPQRTSFVPGTSTVNGEPSADPVFKDEHLLFYLQPEHEIQVSYWLRYADREQIPVGRDGEQGAGAARTSDTTDIGLISMGVLPRVLLGDDSLLALLDATQEVQPREREGVVILYPYAAQTLTNQRHTDIEVDAPQGAQVSVSVNGEIISEDRIGAIGDDDALGRKASKYIAIPLVSGANTIVATALTEDGETLTDEIVVYRSGSPAHVSIDPITELVTGRVHPIVFQITVTDEDGLPPANGTEATVSVEGGLLASEDARPEWIGHQVLLYNGRVFIAIEPPEEATELTMEVSVGQIDVVERFIVSSQTDQWMVIGHGLVRADGIASPANDLVSVETTFRALVHGPFVYDTVLTLAVNMPEKAGRTAEELWTGDTSSSGAYGMGSGPFYARVERGLSFAQYGRGSTSFGGVLSGYSRNQQGLQFEWNKNPHFNVTGFYGQDAVDTLEELLEADGTGYFTLKGHNIEPFSEDVSIVIYDAQYPYDVIRVMRLSSTHYYLDYATGRLILAEPLPGIDDWGNKVTLRVRYRPEGSDQTVGVGGVQGTYESDTWLIRGTYLNRLTRDDQRSTLVALGAGTNVLGYDVNFELARSTTVPISGGSWAPGMVRDADAFLVSVKNPDLFGWSVEADHRRIDPSFVGADTTVEKGISTSLKANRTFDNNLGLTVATSISQDHEGAPTNQESSVSTRWFWGRIRPEVGLVARSGDAKESSLSVRAGVGADMPHGSLGYRHERPVSGEAPVTDTIEARLELSRYQIAQLSLQAMRPHPGAQPLTRVGLGITHSLVGDRTNTRFHGGYELPGGSALDEGRVVLGAQTHFTINDRNALNFSVDHRRPLVPTTPSGFGSSLGWTYRHLKGGESEWRIDFSSEGSYSKYALQWRGLHPVSDAFTLRGSALYTTDHFGDKRTRLGLGGAYRTASSIVLGNISGDHAITPSGRSHGTEWRIQGASQFTDNLVGHAGYARRETSFESIAAATPAERSMTDKWNVGGRLTAAPRLELLGEGSILRQEDSGSIRTGAMFGIGIEMFKDLWLTLGYGTTDFVAYDHAGDKFSRSQSGIFVQIDWAFDEWSLRRLLPGRRE